MRVLKYFQNVVFVMFSISCIKLAQYNEYLVRTVVTDDLVYTGPSEVPAQRPVRRSLDVFFDLCPTKQLSKQPWGWWFEMPSWSLWRHCNANATHHRIENSTGHSVLKVITIGWSQFQPGSNKQLKFNLFCMSRWLLLVSIWLENLQPALCKLSVETEN